MTDAEHQLFCPSTNRNIAVNVRYSALCMQRAFIYELFNQQNGMGLHTLNDMSTI